MEITAKVLEILPAKTGTSAKGEWSSTDVVFDITEGTYERKLAVRFFNKAEDLAKIKVGGTYEVGINISSREHNGNYYTECQAWRVKEVVDTTASNQMPI